MYDLSPTTSMTTKGPSYELPRTHFCDSNRRKSHKNQICRKKQIPECESRYRYETMGTRQSKHKISNRRIQRITVSSGVPAYTTCSRKNLSSFLISISSLSKRCTSRFVACFFRLNFLNLPSYFFISKYASIGLLNSNRLRNLWSYAQVAPIDPRIQFFTAHNAICCTFDCRAMLRRDFVTPLGNRPLRNSKNLS